MSDVLDELSSYNIFNYLLPGTLFAAAGSLAESPPPHASPFLWLLLGRPGL